MDHAARRSVATALSRRRDRHGVCARQHQCLEATQPWRCLAFGRISDVGRVGIGVRSNGVARLVCAADPTRRDSYRPSLQRFCVRTTFPAAFATVIVDTVLRRSALSQKWIEAPYGGLVPCTKSSIVGKRRFGAARADRPAAARRDAAAWPRLPAETVRSGEMSSRIQNPRP